MALASLNFLFRADTQNFNKKLSESQKKIGGLTSVVKKFAPAVGAAFAIRAIVNFSRESARLAGIQEQAFQKVSTAVNSTGQAAGYSAKELAKIATELQAITTFGDEDILNNVTAQLLTFTNIAGNNFERAQVAAMDLATLLDGDLKSASIQLGKALNDPVANLSALSRSGIQFSAQQKDLIKGLTESNKLHEAQAIILDEINRQYGGQAEAMAKLPMGKVKQLQNIWGDFREMLGSQLLPIIGNIAEKLSKFLTEAMAKFPAFRAKVVDAINSMIDFYNETEAVRVTVGLLGAAFKSAFVVIDGAIKQSVNGVKTLFTAIDFAIKGQFGQAGKAIIEGFKNSISIAKEAGGKIADNFVTGIQAAKKKKLEPILIDSADQAELNNSYRNAGAEAGGSFWAGFENVKPVAISSATITELGEAIKRLPRAVDSAKLAMSSMRIMGENTFDKLTERVQHFNHVLVESLKNAFVAIGDGISNLATGQYASFFEGMIDIVANFLRAFGTALIAAGVASEKFQSILVDPAGGILAGIALIATSGIIKNLLKNPFADAPKLAEGGLAYAPTMAVVGDNPRARVDPEVIAPLSKLQGMMGGGDGYIAETIIRGRDLAVLIKKENEFKART